MDDLRCELHRMADNWELGRRPSTHITPVMPWHYPSRRAHQPGMADQPHRASVVDSRLLVAGVPWCDARVTIEIRPPTQGELPDYYRALPFANGLPSWEPAPAAWHGGPEPWPPMRSPATSQTLERWATAAATDVTFHPVAAIADGKVVGASAMLSMEVTVPGGSFLPTAGVTGTGVIATTVGGACSGR